MGLAALLVSLALAASGSDTRRPGASWAADNGNGTYSNPLFYDALRIAGGQFVSVRAAGKAGDVTLKSGKPGDGETFQWVDLQRGEILLLSLATHRHIVAPKTPGAVAADDPGPAPDRRDGSCFVWKALQHRGPALDLK
jgi:hypothetical protein